MADFVNNTSIGCGMNFQIFRVDARFQASLDSEQHGVSVRSSVVRQIMRCLPVREHERHSDDGSYGSKFTEPVGTFPYFKNWFEFELAGA